MSTGEVEKGIGPYLKPKFWDGHTIGMGDSTLAPSTPLRAIPLLHRMKKGSRASISTGMTRSLQTYETGDVFSSRDYPPGTFFIYSKEALYGRGALSLTELSEIEDLELPEQLDGRPVSNAATGILNPLSPTFIRGERGRSYLRALHLGAIESFGKKRAVVSVPISGVRKEADDLVFDVSTSPALEPETLEIGKVLHLETGITGGTRIQRVGGLEIHGIGADQDTDGGISALEVYGIEPEQALGDTFFKPRFN